MSHSLEKISQDLVEKEEDRLGRPFGTFKFSVMEVKEKVGKWMDSFKDGGERKGEVPTLSCLAFDLGIARRTLVDYQHRDDYQPILERAKTFCEMHCAQKLFDPSIRPAGLIFNLKANHGWKDGTENKGINFSWNAVQIEAEKVRKQLFGLDEKSNSPKAVSEKQAHFPQPIHFPRSRLSPEKEQSTKSLRPFTSKS